MDSHAGAAPGEKQCPRCRRPRPEESFRASTGKPTTTCAACRDLSRRGNRAARRRLGAAGVRAAHLWQKYGITADEYDALRVAQGSRCKICGRDEETITAVPTGRPRLDGKPAAEAVRLVVDHCHDSGRVRGLLCAQCNAMIGQARDRPEILRAAATYLEAGGAAVDNRAVSTLRIVDVNPRGRPPRTVRLRGSARLRVDGYLVQLTAGETKTVISSTGEYEVVRDSSATTVSTLGHDQQGDLEQP